jgi:transposase
MYVIVFRMLGRLHQQNHLFTYHINLESRIRLDHPLRRIKKVLDLSWVPQEVSQFYGRNGNVSIDPIVLVKLMILLVLDDVPSERELMARLGERLDYLWFLGFGLDDPIPHHSVLSKARTRWGEKVFESIFTRTLAQCVEAGLVDGQKVYVDSTLVKASCSKNSILEGPPELIAAIRQQYRKQTAKLENSSLHQQPKASATVQKVDFASGETSSLCSESFQGQEPRLEEEVPAQDVVDAADALVKDGVNGTHVSLTDPDATLAMTKKGFTELSYKHHRLIDDAHGVITAIKTTTGSEADGAQLEELVQSHQAATGVAVETAVGDKHYGTAQNYRFCQIKGIASHLGKYEASRNKSHGIFEPSAFIYEEEFDRYRCPNGNYLYYHNFNKPGQWIEYLVEEQGKCCEQCALRPQCTKSKRGRSITKPIFTALVEQGAEEAQSKEARKNRKRRKYLMEGSFANDANNHGLKFSRWRGLPKQRMQDWLIAALQNLRLVATRWGGKTAGSGEAALSAGRAHWNSLLLGLQALGPKTFSALFRPQALN